MKKAKGKAANDTSLSPRPPANEDVGVPRFRHAIGLGL
jgi:hypothetical protein